MLYNNIIYIKVKFEYKVVFWVYDEINNEIIEDVKGNLYIEMEILNDYNLYSYILFFGDGVEVLELKEIWM